MAERLVQLPGLEELQRALKGLRDADATKQVRAAGKKIAADIVIPAARGRATTRLQRRAAETLKPSTVGTGSAVRFGAGFPGAFGAEFGAYRNQRRRTSRGQVTGWNQFQPWRGSGGDAGYFLWPGIRDATPEILAAYGDAIAEIFREGA